MCFSIPSSGRCQYPMCLCIPSLIVMFFLLSIAFYYYCCCCKRCFWTMLIAFIFSMAYSCHILASQWCYMSFRFCVYRTLAYFIHLKLASIADAISKFKRIKKKTRWNWKWQKCVCRRVKKSTQQTRDGHPMLFLMLAQCLRRCPNIKTTLGERLVFAGGGAGM